MNIRGKTEQVWFFALAALSMHVSAQCHFTFTPNTGNNMTVLVRTSINPNINGEPLEAGDEIGVFNRNGLCAGSIQWNRENAGRWNRGQRHHAVSCMGQITITGTGRDRHV
jgi:hypothetical protein